MIGVMGPALWPVPVTCKDAIVQSRDEIRLTTLARGAG